MGLLKSILKTAVDTATLPLSVTVDVLETLDGGNKESETKKNINRIAKDVVDVVDKTI
jgi:hypothetical protein